jgi:hypothetical protein
MTMLTHPGGPSARPRHASESRDPARIGAAAAYLATAKRLFARVLVLLAAGLTLFGGAFAASFARAWWSWPALAPTAHAVIQVALQGRGPVVAFPATAGIPRFIPALA